ncbi:YvbH-like oligomerisation region [Marininema mesophilum]|uniref:YvbH-like oligomerisation region n=1 Tax=Marininema mesophilum TaxID=1048340 RepID=A0A1H2WIJ5_9BACL|nr:PH domain-containing protein [Marininema mesophilum]SDW80440.1 YvbH-like oligomerisation region [Marininema mesophilum]
MFGKVAADVLGLSDVGAVIKPQDYDKVDSDDYVLHEDGEKIYFLIKSKSDEYCFTNKALIHLDGTSATSKKRMLRRYDYHANRISDVMLETAGTMDRDVEIKFTLGSINYSIDVNKNQLEELKDLYKSLIRISEITSDNAASLNFANQSLELASAALGRMGKTDGNLVEEFTGMNQVAFDWLEETRLRYRIKDFGFVFERYINM